MKFPSEINSEGINGLASLAKEYPYSSVLQVLYAKGLHNIGDLDYEHQLRKAALVTPDRSLLYKLIYSAKLKETITRVEAVTKEEVIEEPIEVNIKEIAVEVTTESVDKTEEPGALEKVEHLSDELEQDILLEAINNSIQIDVTSLLNEDISDDLSKWKQPEVDKFVPEVQKTPVSLSDWLLAMKKVDEPTADKPLASSKDLIDKFINTRPKKIDVTKEPLTPQELGKLSLLENEDFVTETLASIYAKQGKFDRAIKIYDQLIVKFPEKKTFFASRIRFLREKMEYDK